MSIDLAKLGKKLSAARTNCGITQEAAAAAIGVSRSAIALIESGDRSISTLELAGLASLYNRPIAEFFDETAEQTDPLALCRVAPEFEDHPEVGRTIGRLLEVCQEGIELERLLSREHRDGPPAYSKPAPKNYAEAVEQGKAVASEERRRLAIGDAPVANIGELISSDGIWAAAAELPDEMSGLFLHHSSIGFVVLVNSGHARSRKRFSYAHEYAHALFDRNQSTMTVTSQKNSKELIERRANAFAAAFLLPKGGIEALLRSQGKGAPSRATHHTYDVATDGHSVGEKRAVAGDQQIGPKDVASIAHHFGTSYQATAYRLSDLNYVNRDELASLLERESAGNAFLKLLNMWEDLYKKDTSEPELELGAQLVPLAVEAFRREEISRGKLLELGSKLGLPAPKLLELAGSA